MSKKCFVPTCLNTSQNSGKMFIHVPQKSPTRKAWFLAVGIKNFTKTKRHCCEDHFNLKEGSIDYLLYKRTGSTPRIKEGVVPHLHLRHNTQDIAFSQLQDRESNESSEESPPLKRKVLGEIAESKTTSESSASTSEGAGLLDTSFKLSEETESSSESDDSHSAFKEISRRREFLAIEMHPRFYLGLPSEVYHLVKIIAATAHIVERDIFIVLKKIRLNDIFFRLGTDFGFSASYTRKLFDRSISKVAACMKHFVYWPSDIKIKQFLPIPFRYRYRNVISIIDCFEISIEKPSNAIHQAMTWSNCKNTNTIKYLISCTPYGFINYISEGYGGRATDRTIVENSVTYLDKLSPSSAVLADRGFKHCASILSARGIKLIRPPSVSAEEVLTAQEVRESRNIAALRIHIERVIGRIRDFTLLSPHAHIDIHLLQYLDACVIIACGILNVQPELIKMVY